MKIILFFCLLAHISWGKCSTLLNDIANEGKSLSQHLNQALLEKDESKIEKALNAFPTQTTLHMLKFSQDETMPFTARLFALRQTYRKASSSPKLPHWLKQELVSDALSHVENFIEIQTAWANGHLSSEYSPQKSLTKSNVPERFRGLNIPMNDDLSVLNNTALELLAKLEPDLFLKKIHELKDLALTMIEKTDEGDPATRKKAFKEIERTFSNLSINQSLDLKLFGKTFQILADNPYTLDTAIEMTNGVVQNFQETRKDKETQKIWDQNVTLFNQNLPEYLPTQLESAEAGPLPFYRVMSICHDIGQLRSCMSEPRGTQELAMRLRNTIARAKGRSLSRDEIVNLHADEWELYLRTQDSTKSQPLEIVSGVREVLLKSAQDSQASPFAATQKRMGNPFEFHSSFVLLNQYLSRLSQDEALRAKVMKDTTTKKLIEKIAKDKDSAQIYGEKNVKEAEEILSKSN